MHFMSFFHNIYVATNKELLFGLSFRKTLLDGEPKLQLAINTVFSRNPPISVNTVDFS